MLHVLQDVLDELLWQFQLQLPTLFCRNVFTCTVFTVHTTFTVVQTIANQSLYHRYTILTNEVPLFQVYNLLVHLLRTVYAHTANCAFHILSLCECVAMLYTSQSFHSYSLY